MYQRTLPNSEMEAGVGGAFTHKGSAWWKIWDELEFFCILFVVVITIICVFVCVCVCVC